MTSKWRPRQWISDFTYAVVMCLSILKHKKRSSHTSLQTLKKIQYLCKSGTFKRSRGKIGGSDGVVLQRMGNSKLVEAEPQCFLS